MSGGELSGFVTATLLIAFLGGWVWAWRPARRADFDAAARLPLDDTDREPRA